MLSPNIVIQIRNKSKILDNLNRIGKSEEYNLFDLFNIAAFPKTEVFIHYCNTVTTIIVY